MVCDFQELYRHLIDDFLIQYCQGLRVKDFIVKTEDLTRNKKGKRVYLNDVQTRDLMKQLNKFFESHVVVPRMNVCKKQTIETLINEEALLLAKHLRTELNAWNPRLASFSLKMVYDGHCAFSSQPQLRLPCESRDGTIRQFHFIPNTNLIYLLIP